MMLYYNAEINAFALFILLLIFFNTWRYMDKNIFEQKLFLSLIIVNTLILITDGFTWIFDGNMAPASRLILQISATMYYILQPVISLIWYLYVDFQINHSLARFKNHILYMILPFILYSALAIISNFYNFFFYYDMNNVYHRGHYFYLVHLMSILFITYTTIYVLINRKRIYKKFFRSLIIFAIPLIFGVSIQFIFYGISAVWPCMALSLLIIFINIQNEQMNMDFLTGLFNRRQLDLYLKEQLKKKHKKIAGIMLDINSFKNINDQYGHYTGDEALKHASALLKQTFDNRAFLSRYGGDEFVILLEVESKHDLDKAISELRENVICFNKKNTLSYEIDFSIGAGIYKKATFMSVQEFINYIDSLMYQDKKTLLQLN